MSTLANSLSQASRRFVAGYATLTAITFLAAAGAPTPIYRLYQESFGLTPLAITLIFGAYAATMVVALLTVARLSDFVGRRPMVFAALALNTVALVLFLGAGSGAALVVARATQGVATGIALASLGAMIADATPVAAATLNSVTAFIGLAMGALGAGALVAYAPWPRQLVYVLLIDVTLVQMIVLAFAPETASRRAGAWSVARPNLALPVCAVGAMLKLFPLTLSAWGLGGFYLSLMPSVVVAATGVRSPLTGAAMVAALMLTGGASVLASRGLAAPTAIRGSSALLAIGIVATVGAIAAGSPASMFAGAMIAGVGFGASYGAALRTLFPLAAGHERAGLLSAYFVMSYVVFALPAILAGLAVPHFGLVATALGYGVVLAVAALVTLAIELARRPRAEAPSPLASSQSAV